MDDTQRLERNDDEEEEETSITRDRPAGNLHMFAGVHGPAQDFPIYYGKNTIGRHCSCDITLPAQSVSKKHAILEVNGDCHTICDNGSLNKTRRGKAALAPNICYALSDGDFLLFADVACRYTIVEKVEAEPSAVEESEDNSALVPDTPGPQATTKLLGAAIHRIAHLAELTKDSVDEEGQTRWNKEGCRSVMDSHKKSAPESDFPPDTVVPETDEENDTSTSETPLPSLNLQCDSDTDTSRRSFFVPSSQITSTPLALKADDKKPTDAEMTPRSPVEGKREERMGESTSGGDVSEPCVEVAGTVDETLKKEQECEKLLQDDAIKKPSSDTPSSSPCVEDNVTSSSSETVKETSCGLTPKEDDTMQVTVVKVSDTDVKPTEDKAGIQEDATTSGTDGHPAETSGSQINRPEAGGNGRFPGPGGMDFHMDSDTDDEAVPPGSDLEKSKSSQIAHIKESEASAPQTSRNEEDSDCETDVEGDHNVTQSKSGVEQIVREPSKTEGTAGLDLDSDTNDAGIPKQTETSPDQDSRSNTQEKKEEFHLDSDSDDEDVSMLQVKEGQAESPKASVKKAKDVFNLESDTDEDEEGDVPSSDVAHGPPDSSTASTSVQETTGADNDTDVNADDQKADRANVTSADNDTMDQTSVSAVTAALHMDTDTDIEEDDDPVTNVGSPEGIIDIDGAKKDNKMPKEPADLHLDGATDAEESDGPSVVSKQEENQVEADVEDPKPSVSSTNQSVVLSGNSTEVAKNVPAEICSEEDETQKSESESMDMEMMPTQCYLEPLEESDLADEEEEATQAYVVNSTWAEPDPFKRPANPIDVLQISSVTLNSTEEDIDETSLAETQSFCTEAEPIGPSVQETPGPVGRHIDETIPSSSSEDESGREVQQVSHEILSSEATQPISQYLSTKPSEEAGTWLHLKREVPASVWIRGLQQEESSTNLEGDHETTKDATQTEEQSLKLELEATQLYSEESPSGEKPPVQTETVIAPAAVDENKEPEGPEKPTEQPCSEDTQITDIDATQAYSLSVPDSDGTTQACSLPAETTGGDADATSANTDATEEDNTQVVNPSIAADEAVVPETSSENKEKPSSRRGLRSKKKAESAQSSPTSSEIEENPNKPSTAPECIREEPDKPNAGESQRSEPEIKEVRRRGGRRNADSLSKTPANEEVVATTSQTRTTKKSLEDEPLEVNEPPGRKQVSRRNAIKMVNEELKEEQEKSSSNSKELKESFGEEIQPGNPPEEIEGLTSGDKKGTTVEQLSEESGASLENQETLSTEASTSSTVTEGKELMDSKDNSAEKSQPITENKKPARNKRRVATRPKKEEADETESVGNVEKDKDLGGRHLRTTRGKEESKQISESLQSQQITQEESQGRKATRKTRTKDLEPESDKDTDITEENKAAEEAGPSEPLSGTERSRRTRSSLKEEVENLPETKGKTRRSASVKGVQSKNKEKEQGKLEDMPTSNKTPRSNSREETPKPEQEIEDVKTEDIEVVRKSRRIQKSQKEEQKTESNIETQKTPSSDSQTSKRTRRDYREENVNENTSRRTRRKSKEEEEEENQTKKSRKARKDSMEETKIEEAVEQTSIEDKEETVGRKATRKRRNVKDQNTSVLERESKETEDNSKPERSPRTCPKLSPPEEKPKPQVGRGRQAAKKEDVPQPSTPVASRKRGQQTKAEVEEKRKKSDDEEQEKLVETPKSRRGRPRKLVTEEEITQTEKDISPPDPSPSRQKASSALSNSQETRTPRRTNRRTPVSATSPYAQTGSPPKILFTGVVDTAGEEAIRSLGGEVADSVFDCTHLVTDRVRRTVKFLCALARGIPIVTLDWINKCKKSGCFLSPTGFLVNDKEQEKNFSFVLSESLQKAKKRPLFEGYEIHVTANVKPEPEQMKDIIVCSGATFLPKMPRSFKQKCIIVSCPQDAARCKSVPSSVPVTSAEFILSGILRQEVNPTAYLVNPAVQDSAPTPAKRRR
ncbi:mediator of DNA damage checkpoint protein 1 [Leptodactylus fuscus]|uniref:mediator of DNA damage checkpoint protein 1 n=1 Tax=Leptodactylus fuscus TaxID=238119 RepID=UPI003F4E79FF